MEHEDRMSMTTGPGVKVIANSRHACLSSSQSSHYQSANKCSLSCCFPGNSKSRQTARRTVMRGKQGGLLHQPQLVPGWRLGLLQNQSTQTEDRQRMACASTFLQSWMTHGPNPFNRLICLSGRAPKFLVAAASRAIAAQQATLSTALATKPLCFISGS
ncbi:hypothetical protein LY76DRAFT_361218 [Colletotrichum caudatum]|nr:hypothetical protein LY76DRAFT_361218 [Colletotrichum caudatum]